MSNVRFYHCVEMGGMFMETEVQVQGYSEEAGDVIIEAWTIGGLSVTDSMDSFTVERPGRFARPLTYGDLRHFRCLEAA